MHRICRRFRILQFQRQISQKVFRIALQLKKKRCARAFVKPFENIKEYGGLAHPWRSDEGLEPKPALKPNDEGCPCLRVALSLIEISRVGRHPERVLGNSQLFK